MFFVEIPPLIPPAQALGFCREHADSKAESKEIGPGIAGNQQEKQPWFGEILPGKLKQPAFISSFYKLYVHFPETSGPSVPSTNPPSMNPPVYLDRTCYESLLDFMSGHHTDDLHGQSHDTLLFHEDRWLMDSAVCQNIVARRGNWEIFLVFVHPRFPLKLIRRKITSCFHQRKAQLMANHMRRQAAKDARGTVTIKASQFVHCLN